MALTLTATPGSASANTYATLAALNTLIESLYPVPATAAAASTDNKNRALATACRQLTTKHWKGERVDDTQALPWPRGYVVNPDLESVEYYAETVIPDRVKRAQMLIALAMLEGEYVPDSVGGSSIEAFQTDGVQVQFAKNSGARAITEFPAEARQLLAPLLEGMRLIKG